MTNCVACGKVFDNELWMLEVSTKGDPKIRVFKHFRCDECWKKVAPKQKGEEGGTKFYRYGAENGETGYSILRCG